MTCLLCLRCFLSHWVTKTLSYWISIISKLSELTQVPEIWANGACNFSSKCFKMTFINLLPQSLKNPRHDTKHIYICKMNTNQTFTDDKPLINLYWNQKKFKFDNSIGDQKFKSSLNCKTWNILNVFFFLHSFDSVK